MGSSFLELGLGDEGELYNVFIFNLVVMLFLMLGVFLLLILRFRSCHKSPWIRYL